MSFADSLNVASLSSQHPTVSAAEKAKEAPKKRDWYQESIDARDSFTKATDLERWRNSPEYDVNKDTEYWDAMK